MTQARCYWNIRAKNWSVMVDGKVIDHVSTCYLLNPSFVVYKGGRDRVRKEKRKNVHAFAVGDFRDGDQLPVSVAPNQFWHRAKYNPYVNDGFVDAYDRPLTSKLTCVRLESNGKVFYV